MSLLNLLERVLDERGLSDKDALDMVNSFAGTNYKYIEHISREHMSCLISSLTGYQKNQFGFLEDDLDNEREIF